MGRLGWGDDDGEGGEGVRGERRKGGKELWEKRKIGNVMGR